MALAHPRDHREPQAGALGAAGDERIEDPRAQLGRHAGAAVGHAEGQAAVLAADRQLDRGARRARLQGVAHQVDQRLLDPLGVEVPAGGRVRVVEHDPRRIGELDGSPRDRPRVAGRGLELAGAHEVEEAGRQRLEAHRLLDDPAGLGAPALVVGELLLEQLGVALEAGERVADLVGQDGGHLAQRGQVAPLGVARLGGLGPLPLAVRDPGGDDQRDRDREADHEVAQGLAEEGGRQARFELDHDPRRRRAHAGLDPGRRPLAGARRRAEQALEAGDVAVAGQVVVDPRQHAAAVVGSQRPLDADASLDHHGVVGREDRQVAQALVAAVDEDGLEVGGGGPAAAREVALDQAVQHLALAAHHGLADPVGVDEGGDRRQREQARERPGDREQTPRASLAEIGHPRAEGSGSAVRGRPGAGCGRWGEIAHCRQSPRWGPVGGGLRGEAEPAEAARGEIGDGAQRGRG
ncbi:hypothetical protein OV079_19535 [Nannocystis pusilla]|uniref:Uncharacterized protein n=1 Tax=Nannocystis pusilla TaxID=889268 RepID=A0A9X3EP86_9BACT|nr:hypothetical protein [Nannocystis pusilla]MCY1007703.1 hypothetical protein [Nannocystis pusilla]